MSQADDAWVFIFVARKGYVPADQRITAVLKYAKARGLVVTKKPLREVIEHEHFSLLCEDCRDRSPTAYDRATWWHPETGLECRAAELRQRLLESRRQEHDRLTNDAGGL